DALDLCATRQLPALEGRLEVGHLAAERRNRVGDLEGDAGMDRVGLPRPGRDALAGLLDGAHVIASSLILDESKLDCARIIARNLAGASIAAKGVSRPLAHPGGDLAVGAVDRAGAAHEAPVDPARPEIRG